MKTSITIALLTLLLASSALAQEKLAGPLFIDVGQQPISVKCDRRDPDGTCWLQCGRLRLVQGVTNEWRWASLCRQMRRLFIAAEATPTPAPTPRPTASARPTATPYPIGDTPCERGDKGWCLVWSPVEDKVQCVRCNL